MSLLFIQNIGRLWPAMAFRTCFPKQEDILFPVFHPDNWHVCCIRDLNIKHIEVLALLSQPDCLVCYKKQFAKNSDYICSRITSQPTYLGHVFALSVVNALILHLMLAILRKINSEFVIVDFV